MAKSFTRAVNDFLDHLLSDDIEYHKARRRARRERKRFERREQKRKLEALRRAKFDPEYEW